MMVAFVVLLFFILLLMKVKESKEQLTIAENITFMDICKAVVPLFYVFNCVIILDIFNSLLKISICIASILAIPKLECTMLTTCCTLCVM